MRQRTFEPQKKPERERGKNKEISELKKEIHALKRQLSRARKQISELLDARNQVEEAATEASPATFAGPVVRTCESCESTDVVKMDFPNGAIIICKSCKHRKKDK